MNIINQQLPPQETAMLFTHGIFGSPDQFKNIQQAFDEKGYATQAILLPGHGGTAREFGESGEKFWRECVKTHADELKKKYKHVLLVGHSMGGLLSFDYAAKYGGVDAIFALAVPMRLIMPVDKIKLCANLLFGDPKHDNPFTAQYRNSMSVDQSAVEDYLTWIKPLCQLLDMARVTRYLLPKIKVRVFICQSKNDRTVSADSANVIRQYLINSPKTRLMRLKYSGHSQFEKHEEEVMIAQMLTFADMVLHPPVML